VTDAALPIGGPPDPGCFQRVADDLDIVLFILRVRPDVAFEFIDGGMRTQLRRRRPDSTPVAAGLLEQIHPDSADDLAVLLRMEPGQTRRIDLKWRNPGGAPVYSQGWVQSRERADGSVVVEGVLRDATEPGKVESELQRSEERHRLLAENAWDVIWTMALDGSITYVSPAIERVRGITASEAMAQTPEQVNPPASAAIVAGYFKRLFDAIDKGTEPPEFRGELEYYRGDGSIMVGELQVVPHVGADGKVVEILGVTRDISEQKLLDAAEARYRKLMDNSVVATSLLAPDGTLLLVNEAMCKLVGYDAEALQAIDWDELTVRDHPAEDREAVAELLDGRRESYRTTIQYVHADGHRIWGDLSLSCIRKENGEAEHLVAQIIDVTGRVESQHRLAERERRNRALAERLRAELDSAARYIASILPGDLVGPVRVSSRYLPAQEVGGDCFDYTWIDDDHLIVYLIDVSGHGVEPALVSVSVHNMLRSGSLSRQTLGAPEQVLSELNSRFPMEKHGGNYFTIWYGVYQASSRTLRYAGAGHPPAMVFADGLFAELASQSGPVGMFGDTEFAVTSMVLPTACQVLLYSDGVLDLALPGDQVWTRADFTDLCTELAAGPDGSLDGLIERLQHLTDTDVLEDDCTLVQLRID
jgi:PAS domain S-box-containing protein